MSAQPSPKPALSQAIKPCLSIGLDRHRANHIVIRWRVARRSLSKIALAGTAPIVHLEFRLGPSLDPVWALVDPTSHAKHMIELKTDSGPVHTANSPTGIVIESPHLCAHICTSNRESPELVYVRTHIFAQLEIPGGRYEPIGCSLNTTGV